jgi:IS4 transposase
VHSLLQEQNQKTLSRKLCLVEFHDSQNDELLVFLTNNFEVSALEDACLYKNRWQIEIFFK